MCTRPIYLTCEPQCTLGSSRGKRTQTSRKDRTRHGCSLRVPCSEGVGAGLMHRLRWVLQQVVPAPRTRRRPCSSCPPEPVSVECKVPHVRETDQITKTEAFNQSVLLYYSYSIDINSVVGQSVISQIGIISCEESRDNNSLGRGGKRGRKNALLIGILV